MSHLKYYKDEREEFKEAFEKLIVGKRADLVFKKLSKHFKLENVDLEWTSGRNYAKGSRWRIKLNSDWSSYGVMCHELAHTDNIRNGIGAVHNKKHWKVMKRMINYCSKKNWFEDEIERRLAPKPKKIEPSKEEIKAKEIIRLQENIIRYEKKILYWNKKLNKARKKYNLKMSYNQRNHPLVIEIVGRSRNDTHKS